MKKEVFSYLMLFVIAVSAAILTYSVWTFIGITLLLGCVLLVVKLVKLILKKDEKSEKASQILCLIVSILSVFLGTIWYLALATAITTLIISIIKIRKNGSTLAKVSTSFSIIGIVNCIFIYITAIIAIMYSLV